MKRSQKIALAASGACSGNCAEAEALRRRLAETEEALRRKEVDFAVLLTDRDRLNKLEKQLRLQVQGLTALAEQRRVV